MSTTPNTIPTPLLETVAPQGGTTGKRGAIGQIIWCAAFIVVIIVVLVVSKHEKQAPLRLWLILYAVRCLLNMLSGFLEYRALRDGSSPSHGIILYVNLLFSFIWWVVGLCWVISRRKTLSHEAPNLFWLTVAFLAFDVFAACLMCIIGMGVCCCMPIIMAVIYLIKNSQEDDSTSSKTKYIFKTQGDETEKSSGGIMVKCDTDTPTERVLSSEDVTCSICHSEYENGSELYELPCEHHFHCACIDEWLQTSPNCPVCNYNMNTGTTDNENNDEQV